MIRQFAKDFRILHNADRLAERIFLVIVLLFVAFILFASLTNPNHKYKLTANALLRLISLPAFDSAHSYYDPEDISSNVLFYIPLGIFLSLVVSFRKPRFLTPWIAGGFLLSLGIEICQYFVGRYPDPMDLLTNAAGYLFGFEIGVFAIKYLGLRPSAVIGINPDDQTTTKLNTIASIRFFYIAVYLVSSFVPFDFSFHLSSVYAKLNPDRYGQLRLILDPFYHLIRWSRDSPIVTGLFLGVLPVGILSALMGGFRKKLRPWPPVLTCLWLATACEIGQLFIVSRVSDVLMFPLAILAGISGWMFARAWLMLQEGSDYHVFKSQKERNIFLEMLIGGYVLILIFSTLSPYRFEYSLKAVHQKLAYQSNWIPFQAHVMAHNQDSIFAIIKGVGAFLPLGLLITYGLVVCCGIMRRMYVIAACAICSTILALLLETIKVMEVGYYFDFTYVFLAALGGAVGSVLYRVLSKTV